MTPWQLAKPGTEHAEQSALFAWLNCAAIYGTGPANHGDTYAKATRDDVLEAFKLTGGVKPVPALAYIFAIHNQGHGDAIRGGRARAEGVKAGAPDICIPIVAGGHPGAFIELKKLSVKPKRETSKGGVAEKQSDFHSFLSSQGYFVGVCYGWQEARDFIKWYLSI